MTDLVVGLFILFCLCDLLVVSFDDGLVMLWFDSIVV